MRTAERTTEEFIMKKTFITLLFAAAASMVTQAWAGSLAGVPMKDHHLKAFGQSTACRTCHGTAVPTGRPDQQSCIACHGTMDKIPTKPNKFEKFPHASEHYGNTVECTVCHSEHKASWALCNECHVVEFPNLK